MKQRRKLNKSIKLLILILGIIVLAISASYAVFSIRHENTTNQIVKAGELELTYNSCTTMTTEMVPMSNTDGLDQAGCNVTVENTGSLDAIYKVLIYNNLGGSNQLSHDNLYVSIDNSEPVILSTIIKLESTDKYNLKEEILLVEETKTHNIKLWIKEDATTDIIGKSVNLIIDIEAVVSPCANCGTLMVAHGNSETAPFLSSPSPVVRNNIESIVFATHKAIPGTVLGSWDVSTAQDNSVIAWYEDTDIDSKYEITIGGVGGVKANANSSILFENIRNLDNIDLTHFYTREITNMSSMFGDTGSSNPSFTLDLGDNFDTSNVTDMSYMFGDTGRSSTSFTLELGDNFDTSKVTNMNGMFSDTGYNSTGFTLDLKDKFDTSNVTNMVNMFYHTGYSNPNFTLDLGDKFDTSNVTNMMQMFSDTGRNSTMFTLDLGDKFDTSNVTNMRFMFYFTGYSNPNFTLDLRNFNVNAVTSYDNAFSTRNTSHKLYASDSNISFMSGKGFSGTIINCTTSPTLCP